MNVVNCLSPVRIPDPSCKGRYIYVPCGKCDVCRNRLSQDWVHRLEHEAECWQYTVFFTLTYDDNTLPTATLDVVDNKYRLVDARTGRLFDYIPKRCELSFIRKMRRVSYPDVRDFQLFMKRLRYYFNDYAKKHSQPSTMRYFACYEYGPTTHRIHMHGLLFFHDSLGEFTRDIQSFVHRAWQNGIVDTSLVQSGSAAKYVAKYCTVPNNGKSLYNSPEFRVRHLASKNPPIGSLLVNTQMLRTLFESTSLVYRVQVKDSITDVPLSKYIVGRLWPKCPHFSRLNPTELLSVYTISRWFKCEDVNEFVDNVLHCLMTYPVIGHNTVFWYLGELIDYSNKDPYASLKRVYRISKRVCAQADVFNTKLTFYVSQIIKYYRRLVRTNLATMYDMQEKSQHVTPAFPIQVWPSMDADFMSVVLSHDLANMPDWVLYTLEGYGLDPVKFCTSKSYRKKFDYRFYPLASEYVTRTQKMYAETKKIKSKKDYERQNGYTSINETYAKYF